MANRKPKNVEDEARPNKIGVSLSDEVLARLDEFRRSARHKRSQAAALLIERALDAAQGNTARVG